jgi:hypothetical protein
MPHKSAKASVAKGNAKLGIPMKKEFVRAEGTPSQSKAHHKPAAKGFRQRTKDGYE